jgi:hypothetical protein
MVSSENRQLWKRLTRMTRTIKPLDNQSTKISETLKQFSSIELPSALTYSFKEIPGIFRDNINNQYNLTDNQGKIYFIILSKYFQYIVFF